MGIVLSVLVITYQHKKYIRKALDSVLMQKTSFDIEIIVSDDCSTDGTRDILIEYKNKYKNKINLILRNKNMGGTRHGYDVCMKAQGKYICTLEGDDFWTDEYKLEKEVEYLENHPNRMGVFHKCHFVGEYNNILPLDYRTMYDSKEGYSLMDFQNGTLPGHTATFMFRNIFKNSNNKYNFLYRIHTLVGDQTLYCILLTKGDFGYLDEDMSVYRKIIKDKSTNASSIAANNNNSFIMWRYFLYLELAVKKRLGTNVDLSKRRKNTWFEACYWLKDKVSVENLFILVKIFVMESIYGVLKKLKVFN